MIGCIENESPKKDEWHVPSIEPSELNKPVIRVGESAIL